MGLYIVMAAVLGLSALGLYSPLFAPVYRGIARVIVLVGTPA
jgi:hypothetical protein